MNTDINGQAMDYNCSRDVVDDFSPLPPLVPPLLCKGLFFFSPSWPHLLTRDVFWADEFKEEHSSSSPRTFIQGV